MTKVYQVTATRLVRIEVIADDSDDAWDVADASSDSDWEEYGFEIQDVECISGNDSEYFGPDRHGE
jgi:hypothetical protein